MTQGYDGSIRIDTKIDEAGFNKSTSGISAGLGGLKSALLGVAATIAATFSVAVLVRFSSKILNIAADFQRLQLSARIVGGMFGYTDAQVRKLTDDLVESGIQTDIANTAFINFAREGLDTSFLPALARGAQDLAIFAKSGESSSDMFDRLLYGIMQLNPLILRTAGVVVDLEEANKKWAAANNTTAASMSVQEKRLAAMAAVTEKLTGVTGLYEMGQRTAAGQMQSNIRIMNELFFALGTPFQGALYTVVKGFNDLIKAFTAAIGPGGQLYGVMQSLAAIVVWLSQGISSLFNTIAAFLGLTATSTDSTAASAAQAETSLGGAASAAGDLAANTTAAGKAAKGSLAAFDQLNVLALDTGAGGGGATPPGGGGGLPVPLAAPDTSALDAIMAKLDEFKTRLLDVFGPAIEALGRLQAALVPLGETIWAGLKWAWDNILVPLGNWTISNLLPVWLDYLAAVVRVLNSTLVALAPAWMWFWENMLKPAAEWTGQAIIDGITWLTARLEDLSVWIDNNQTAWSAIVIVLGIVTAILFALSSPIAALIVGILATIAMIAWWKLEWKLLSDAATAAWNWIAGVWVTVASWFQVNVIDPLIAFFTPFWILISTLASNAWNWIVGVWTSVSSWFQLNVINPLTIFFASLWATISTLAYDAWLLISLAWSIVTSWFQTNVITPLATNFTTVWATISRIAGEAWDKIAKFWAPVMEWFNTTVINPLREGFGKFVNWLSGIWQTTFTGIISVITSFANGFIDVLNAMMSSVLGGINIILAGINKTFAGIPGWKKIGLLYEFQIGRIGPPPTLPAQPVIPWLATGAVIPPNAQFAAILGDQRSGRNIEAPESLIRQIVREETQGAGGQNINVTFGGTMGELIRLLNPHIAQENKRVGMSLIQGEA